MVRTFVSSVRFSVLSLFTLTALAQLPVTVHVDASKAEGEFKPVWNYFGYDEANYTYTNNGRKLIRELAHLSKTPPHIRTHFLLATGNGAPGLKWGSTNAYTEDESGRPLYDWTIVDRILSTYLEAGAKPFVEIGFMPKALSSKPEPYQPVWKAGTKNDNYSIGWTYPPKDYSKWGSLVYEWVKHSVDKYGKSEVESWEWEVWNEPNISYWHGTPEEYDKLYDYTADAVKRALPTAKIGGPASTSPRDPKAAAFLKQFLEHCSSGRNLATGNTGAPLDFISYHVKGQPAVIEQHVRMGISQELRDAFEGFAIVNSFAKFRDVPIVLSEADPEGCAACSAQVYPQNAYRNSSLYPVYIATAMKAILQLTERDHMNLQGILTWAFEFEDQPYFAGFRDLATNGIDKPVLNVFRMAGLMTGSRVVATSTGAVPLESMLTSGVRNHPDVDTLAVASENALQVLVWNYRDDDVIGPDTPVQVSVDGLPKRVERILLHHYRVDQDHSNAYTVWKQMGSPQHPSPDQYTKLESAGQFQLLESPRWMNAHEGITELHFSLPSQAISLIELDW
ncbi:MAG TPA: beta-xylosidase [Bryobacteraceae bacterium]|nr:beta-xylosidase [Bryobacteraceae bacterium]